ncbi:MAG TPA: hypothetical protein VI365_29865 [Trebonia sp.]
MAPQATIQAHDGPVLATVIQQTFAKEAVSALHADLLARGFQINEASAKSATVTITQTGETYTYLTVPFVAAAGVQNIAAEAGLLVWDNAKGQDRSAHGIIHYEGGFAISVDVYDYGANGVTLMSTLEASATAIRVLDATGRVLQDSEFALRATRNPASEVEFRRTLSLLPADAASDCQLCGTIVDLLYGVLLGSVLGYFLCLTTGVPGGPVGVAIMAIVCSAIVALVLYVPAAEIKEIVCEPWCEPKPKDTKEKEKEGKEGKEQKDGKEQKEGKEYLAEKVTDRVAAADQNEVGSLERPADYPGGHFISPEMRPRVE